MSNLEPVAQQQRRLAIVLSPATRPAIPGSTVPHEASAGAWTMAPVDALSAGDSPRSRVSMDHVQALAEVGADLPPITVHRQTMRVIDGAHRLAAAKRAGHTMVKVKYFDGDSAAAFVVAVRSNVGHGLPLSLAERTAAAGRIVRSYPEWSDRAIAESAGLSPKTVAAIRHRSSEEIPQPDARIGRDGRVRAVRGRAWAGAPPPVRAVSPGADPVTPSPESAPESVPRSPSGPSCGVPPDGVRPAAPDAPMIDLRDLSRDPMLRHNESGRALLRLLHDAARSVRETGTAVGDVPPHCAARVARLATAYADAWRHVADDLRERGGA